MTWTRVVGTRAEPDPSEAGFREWKLSDIHIPAWEWCFRGDLGAFRTSRKPSGPRHSPASDTQSTLVT